MPFAAPCPHRCAAFPKVRFLRSVGREEGEGRGRGRGRELVRCDYYPHPLPIHPVPVPPAVHTHEPTYVVLQWWLTLSPRSEGHHPIRLALCPVLARVVERLDAL